MDILDLKKALLGYKKESVLEYISELQLTYSQKLQEKDALLCAKQTSFQEQLDQLNLEIEQLKQENIQLQELIESFVSMLEIKTKREVDAHLKDVNVSMFKRK